MTQTPWGGQVFFREVTASTMDDAQDWEDRGAPDGSVTWAGLQTAGRGRHTGRQWHGSPESSLLATVFWKPARFRVPSFAASLTVGLGVCRWLESLGPSSFPISLKWPNDVYLGSGKVGGILVRRRLAAGLGSIHAGIGINLAPPTEGVFRTAPAALSDAGWMVTPPEALAGLLPFLASALDESDPRSECERRLWCRNRPLSLALPGGGTAEGLVVGLDASGSLLLEGPRGIEVIRSGE